MGDPHLPIRALQVMKDTSLVGSNHRLAQPNVWVTFGILCVDMMKGHVL
jgi:hypothetical protein